MTDTSVSAIAAVVPAAGIGKRMQSAVPKQYLKLHGKTVLEHSVAKLRAVRAINQIWLALAADDPYFDATELTHSDINRVKGRTYAFGVKCIAVY